MSAPIISFVERLTHPFDAAGERRLAAPLANDRFSLAYDVPAGGAVVARPDSQRTTCTYDVGERRKSEKTSSTLRTTCTYDSVATTPGRFRTTDSEHATLPADHGRYTVVFDSDRAPLSQIVGRPKLASPIRQAPATTPSAYDLFRAACLETDPATALELRHDLIGHSEILAAIDHASRSMPQPTVCGDADDFAQDVVIELMNRFHGSIGRYRDRGPAPFAAWISKLCHDACVDVCRRYWRNDERRLRVVPPELLASMPARPAADDQSLSLRQAIEAISDERQRQILGDLADGRTMAEITTRLGMSHSAAYRLLAQAQAELAKRFPG